MRRILNYLLGEEIVSDLKNNADVVIGTWIALLFLAIAMHVFAS